MVSSSAPQSQAFQDTAIVVPLPPSAASGHGDDAGPGGAASMPVPWMLALLVGVVLLNWLVPHYEASGVQVAPLAPALALAVCASALFGWHSMPFILIGGAITAFGWPVGKPGAQGVIDALTLVAQAGFGGLLLSHGGREDDLALDSRPALRRLLAAALACGVIGGVMCVVGDLIGADDPTRRPLMVALARGTADAGSIVLLLPILMAFVAPAHLRERWLPRRRSVAMPLLAVTALLLVALAGVDERDRHQAQLRFERDAELVFSRTQSLLDASMQALLALQGAFQAASPTLTPEQFNRIAQPWLKRAPGLVGMGWVDAPIGGPTEAAPIAPATAASAAGRAASAPVGHALAEPRADLVIRHALGPVPAWAAAASSPAATVFTQPAVRFSAARATMQEAAAATPPLFTGSPADPRPSFVAMQGVGTGTAAGTRALAYASIATEPLLTATLASRADALRACLFDTDARLEHRRLAGRAGCESASLPDRTFLREAAFEFGGRRWALRVSQPIHTTGSVWLFALPAVTGTALLAVLLLGMTGRVQRVRDEVRHRSDELRNEIDQRERTMSMHQKTVRALLDTVQIGMAMIDPEGRILRANQTFTELAGGKSDALIGRPLDDVLIDSERPAIDRFKRLIQGADDTLAHQTLTLRRSDGRVMPSLVTLRVLRDDAGRTMFAVVTVHDLSENLRRRQVEQVLGSVLDMSMAETRAAALMPMDSPIMQATSPAMPAAAPAPAAAGGATPPGKTFKPAPAAKDLRKLVCISADANARMAVREALHDRPHIKVTGTDTAFEGESLVRSDNPKLVLLDLDLPGADSLALMRSFSDMGVPVIALSKDLRPQRIDEAFAAGARAYLTLPPEARELRAVIDDLI